MKKTTRVAETAPTETDTNTDTGAAPQPVAAAPQTPPAMPSSGGSWTRMPDGSLKKEGNA